MEYPVKIQKTKDSVDLSIVWSIHNFCNFNCSYCPDYNSNGSEKWLNLEKAKEIVNLIHDHYFTNLGYRKILFSFTGGEPLYFKGFDELISLIIEKGMSAGITSNGSGSVKIWERIASKLDFISISYHPEFVNDQSLIKLICLFHDNPNIVIPTIRLMAPAQENTYNKAIKFKETLIKQFKNHSYEFVKIQNDFGADITPSHYTEEQEDFLAKNGYTETVGDRSIAKFGQSFLEHDVIYNTKRKERLRANDLVNKNQINFNNWTCHAGLESLYIDYNGDVFAAGCKIKGALMNLQDLSNVNFPQEPINCHFKKCICQADIMISKSLD